MSDSDITNGELARGITELKTMVGGLVGRAEYNSDQRAVLYRLEELARDLEQERHDRDREVTAVSRRVADLAQAGTQHRIRWHDRLMMGVLPALAALLVGLLTYLAAHGGH